jgi:hypothetical protein
LIAVFIPLSCPGWETTLQPFPASHARKITVSGKPAMLYSGRSDAEGMDRVAVTHCGGQEYDISFHYEYTSETPASQAKAELARFMAELGGFTCDGG